MDTWAHFTAAAVIPALPAGGHASCWLAAPWLWHQRAACWAAGVASISSHTGGRLAGTVLPKSSPCITLQDTEVASFSRHPVTRGSICCHGKVGAGHDFRAAGQDPLLNYVSRRHCHASHISSARQRDPHVAVITRIHVPHEIPSRPWAAPSLTAVTPRLHSPRGICIRREVCTAVTNHSSPEAVRPPRTLEAPTCMNSK